jgi:VanZ family protein
MAVIFRLSSISAPGLPSAWSSPAHFGVYAVLAALCVIALWPTTTPWRAVAIAVMISSAYGVTDEIHQAFVPGRIPDVADWGFDTLGALAGALAMVAVLRILSSRR